jgi:hypothetical protein
MRAMLMTGLGLLAMAGTAAHAEDLRAPATEARDAQPAPLFQLKRRPTPDTTMPGSTSPGNPMTTRRNSNRVEQYYAAELRRCETIGDTTQRLACKDSVRDKFGEM